MVKNITRLPYLYRDENNIKERSFIYLRGRLTEQDIESIQSKLNDGDGFIPFDLGLGIAELQERMGWTSDADQPFHELEFEERTHMHSAPAGEDVIEVSAFVGAFAAIKDADAWNEDAAMARLGIDGDETEE